MNQWKKRLIERDEAENLILLSLFSFAITIIGVRLFLEATGYPQVGNGTLHIAHVLWGGLLLFVAVVIVLIWDNPSVMRLTAVLGGIGIGLFIDEVGKFITQSNDYFFPAAAPIIYGFFLLTVLVYLLVRRPDEDDPRRAMVHALEQIQDAIYGELDEREVNELKRNLLVGQGAEREEIAQMAVLLSNYVADGNVPFKDYKPSLLQRVQLTLAHWMQALGRVWHRRLIVIGLGVTAVAAVVVLAGLLWLTASETAVSEQGLAALAIASQQTDVASINGNFLRDAVQVAIGLVALIAIVLILKGREKAGILFAVIASVLSLTAVQLITFYLDQFTAIIPTIYQLAFLFFVLTYRYSYLLPRSDPMKADNDK
jgi:hypothetical protein